MSDIGAGDLREVLDRMIKSAEFYASLAELRHTPTCWKSHTACALIRVRDLIDGEMGMEDE